MISFFIKSQDAYAYLVYICIMIRNTSVPALMIVKGM